MFICKMWKEPFSFQTGSLMSNQFRRILSTGQRDFEGLLKVPPPDLKLNRAFRRTHTHTQSIIASVKKVDAMCIYAHVPRV